MIRATASATRVLKIIPALLEGTHHFVVTLAFATRVLKLIPALLEGYT